MPDSIHAAFAQAAARWPTQPFLCVLPETARAYGIAPTEISYAQAAATVSAIATRYRAAGYGEGHRIGLMLGNRPDFLLHWFALDACGASVVPINPDLRAEELAYLVDHSEMVLAVAAVAHHAALGAIAALAGRVVAPNAALPAAPGQAGPSRPRPDREAAILYTSGTTGLPKGCVLSTAYFLRCGRWYREMGGLAALYDGQERLLTPLPLFHMNAMAPTTLAMVLSGGCLIFLDRFHPRSWWRSVIESRATIIHYLGVMPAILLAATPSAEERAHEVRFGFGAGIDPTLHAAAEARFGFPFLEGWAMTETGCAAGIQATVEPRHIERACFGRAEPYVQARVVADDGTDATPGEPGELLVRAAGLDPRAGFFSFYLKDPEATATVWKDGWFHTGDIVSRDAQGFFTFVDRKKNVIRRSGENIAALEVESVLRRHELVKDVAVVAAPDPLRGEEVMACIIPHAVPAEPAAAAVVLAAWCRERLAYHKVPGWIAFVEALPLTGTNKIQRGTMKTWAARLVAEPGTQDLRAFKKRTG